MPKTQQDNPVVDMVQYQLDASIHLADAVFSGTEKIDRAMLDVTHHAVDGQLKFVRAVTNMRDPAKLADLQQVMARRPEKAIHCQQEIMAALVELQAEFGKSIRDYIEHFSQTAAHQAETAGETPSGSMPAQSGVMMNPFTGMMSVWEQAFREATRLASQNMLAARSSVEEAANAARDAASRTANPEPSNGHSHGHGSQAGKRAAGHRRKA